MTAAAMLGSGLLLSTFPCQKCNWCLTLANQPVFGCWPAAELVADQPIRGAECKAQRQGLVAAA